jgi:hypothetical protein
VELFTVTVGGEITVNTTEEVTTEHPPTPSGSLLVKVKVTVPEFPAIGVKVIVDGFATGAVELNCEDAKVIDPVTEVILHAPNPAVPPTLDPINIYATPEHIVASLPAVAVAGAFISTFIVVVVAHVGPAVEFGVNVYVCVPTLVVEIVIGLQVPEIPFVDVGCKASAVASLQYGPNWVKDGVVFAITVILPVTVCPAQVPPTNGIE